jgi:hypothetical protein
MLFLNIPILSVRVRFHPTLAGVDGALMDSIFQFLISPKLKFSAKTLHCISKLNRKASFFNSGKSLCQFNTWFIKKIDEALIDTSIVAKQKVFLLLKLNFKFI